MRTHTFTFKKTKRVKVVTETAAISVDLTAKEAADLAAYLRPASTPDCRFLELLKALDDFAKSQGVTSDLVGPTGQNPGCQWSFRMLPVPEAK